MTRLDPQWVAAALGGKVTGHCQVNAPGPGHGDGDLSVSVTITDDDPRGYIVYSHSPRDNIANVLRHVRSQLMAAGGYNPPLPPLWPDGQPRRRRLQRDDEHKRRLALTLWERAVPALGTPVEDYLRGRGLHLPTDVIAAGALRYDAEHPWKMGDPDDGSRGVRKTYRIPAMIALYRDVITDEPVAIHRTSLPGTYRFRDSRTGEWCMLGGGPCKKMLGPTKYAAVKLTPLEGHGRLSVTEGIENALAWLCRTSHRPVWAMGCAGAVASLPVVPGVRDLTILADPDETGISAAGEAAARWEECDRHVTVIRPREDGSDWADQLRA